MTTLTRRTLGAMMTTGLIAAALPALAQDHSGAKVLPPAALASAAIRQDMIRGVYETAEAPDLGALFVAISSWAIGRIGALACALLIVTGQLAGGALLDALAGRLAASDLLGILLVLAGAALQRWQGGKSRSRG